MLMVCILDNYGQKCFLLWLINSFRIIYIEYYLIYVNYDQQKSIFAVVTFYYITVSQIPLPSSSSSSPSSSPSSDRQTVAKVEDEGVPWLRSGKRRTLLGSMEEQV
ncbi:uncharacterized protein LOC117319873 isoform X1 [Pecten maximus]|uniref:uncharacterized protein LOC117319873 isoform X1 n=1 Tax=Pecten maximus TaxID=6579 RepID=UPI001458A420|nr:uncharacterized protein LOC117319873 isoform X1 [Pecten maximus]